MLEFFKNLKLFTKFQLALFVVSVIAQGFIGITSYFDGKRLLTDKSFQLLESITKSKKLAVEEYYQNVKSQLLTLSENSSTIDALQEFQQNFEDLNEQTLEDKFIRKLKLFYNQEFVSKLNTNSLGKYTLENFLQDQSNKRKNILQYHYIARNPNPVEYKYRLNQVQAPSIYHETHLKYHPGFSKYSKTFGYSDIMLADLRGNIVYSVEKSIDYGDNLLRGHLKNTKLTNAYRKILKASKKGYVALLITIFTPLLITNRPVSSLQWCIVVIAALECSFSSFLISA